MTRAWLLRAGLLDDTSLSTATRLLVQQTRKSKAPPPPQKSRERKLAPSAVARGAHLTVSHKPTKPKLAKKGSAGKNAAPHAAVGKGTGQAGPSPESSCGEDARENKEVDALATSSKAPEQCRTCEKRFDGTAHSMDKFVGWLSSQAGGCAKTPLLVPFHTLHPTFQAWKGKKKWKDLCAQYPSQIRMVDGTTVASIAPVQYTHGGNCPTCLKQQSTTRRSATATTTTATATTVTAKKVGHACRHAVGIGVRWVVVLACVKEIGKQRDATVRKISWSSPRSL